MTTRTSRPRLRVRVSHDDRERLSSLTDDLSLSQSDVVRLAVHLLRYVLHDETRKFLLVNSELDAKLTYEVDILRKDGERPLSECSVELVKTDDLMSGVELLETRSFGNNQSEVVRRAISFINDLSNYAEQGWKLCVSHSGTLDSDWLESFELRYPPQFVRVLANEDAEDTSDDVKIDKIVSHLVEQFGNSNLLKMGQRWAKLRGQSLEEFFRSCFEMAEEHLAPDLFGGCNTSEEIAGRLVHADIAFRNIVLYVERPNHFTPLIEGLAYQLCQGAKVFVMLGTVEHAEARCESILECTKEFSSDPISPDSLYSVSVSGSFMETSGLHYPQFVLFDYDVPLLRQGVVWRAKPDEVWKPLLKNKLTNAVKQVGYLIKQAESKGYSLNMHGSVSYQSVDLC